MKSPLLILGAWLAILLSPTMGAVPVAVSGIYPHLAMFNDENECGTGAVVPWADRLWAVTYAPHKPTGSSDKLYEITADLAQFVRPESIGGTPANRMIHRESRQLFIGPYVIDERRQVRVIPPGKMFGRLTGNARHLTDPANKIYCATMEEGLYEIDVKSLAVTELWADEQRPAGRRADLPGYHGKGLYSGQGRIVYANNGDHAREALTNPAAPSGVLAEWDGRSPSWRSVRRNQFTEVTGPGGLLGNDSPSTDPIWSVGWDHRSLILMVLSKGVWSSFRLPKASHAYDGAHGWNTEWPRIRDIGPPGRPDFLMTMHGTFWRFPRDFSPVSSAGLVPRSNYLKVVGDFCRWNDRVVLGCDDAARSEFLNRRRAKGNLAGPGRSQSNLWFVPPEQLDRLGPPLGRGAVWLDESIVGGVPSDAYLFSGFEHRSLHLTHDAPGPVTFRLEVDARGDGQWRAWRAVTVPARGYEWIGFERGETGAWVRVIADRDCARATAFFHYRQTDPRPAQAAAMFDGVVRPTDRGVTAGVLLARGADFRTLRCVARSATGEVGCYDLDGSLRLTLTNDAAGAQWTRGNAAIPRDVLSVDAASVLYVDDAGRRWRLPKGDPAFDRPGELGDARVDREVCTERDLFNAHGTFYELPAENAGGFARLRPISTHNRRIHDYASYRGLLVLSGVAAGATGEHIVRSSDGRCALWVGAVDDLWQFGKPRGVGGPWRDSTVKAGQPSDPYLMTGYDRKRLTLSAAGSGPMVIRVEVDVSGDGRWRVYQSFSVAGGGPVEHEFPPQFGAYWVRAVSDRDGVASAVFTYD